MYNYIYYPYILHWYWLTTNIQPICFDMCLCSSLYRNLPGWFSATWSTPVSQRTPLRPLVSTARFGGLPKPLKKHPRLASGKRAKNWWEHHHAINGKIHEHPLFRLGHFQVRKLWMFTRGYMNHWPISTIFFCLPLFCVIGLGGLLFGVLGRFLWVRQVLFTCRFQDVILCKDPLLFEHCLLLTLLGRATIPNYS